MLCKLIQYNEPEKNNIPADIDQKLNLNISLFEMTLNKVSINKTIE